jgi:hypothetical protein
MVRVFLAGEGRNELGSRVGSRAYQTDDQPGVIATLLTRAREAGWAVGGARGWNSDGKKSFVAKPTSSAARGIAKARFDREDTRIVLVIANDAVDAGCTVLAFLRDGDNQGEERTHAVEDGVVRIPQAVSSELAVIGAVVVPKLEGWVLAARGASHTESLTSAAADRELAAAGIGAKDGTAFVKIFEEMAIDRLPADARRLRAWIEQAKTVLDAAVSEEARLPGSG